MFNWNLFKRKSISEISDTSYVSDVMSGQLICKIYEVSGDRKKDYVNVSEFKLDTVTIHVKIENDAESYSGWINRVLHPDDNGCITIEHTHKTKAKVKLIIYGILK